MRLFLFFSHKLTQEQIDYAKDVLKVDEFITLPKDLQILFSNVPPELERLDEYITPFIDFLNKEAKKGDFVLIQGDFGVSYKLVNFCKQNSLVPIYATTKRVVYEEGDIKKSIFKFIRYREYGA
jgi:hypothetical protein